MLAFISRRLVNSIILLLLVSFISFALVRIDISLPAWHYNLRWGQQQILDISSPETRISAGDPLSDLRLNPSISRETIASEEKRLGLNKSFIEQYWSWLSNILRGDFGYAQNQRKVIDLIKPALLNTFILNILALLCTWIVAISLGIIAALKAHSRLDLGLAVFCTLTMSLPSFVLAIFALFVALQTGLPIGGLSSALSEELSPLAALLDLARHLLLPVAVLSILGLASIQKQMRANLLDVLDQPYIRSARAKGLSEALVIWRHALRNAINPLVSLLGYEFSNIFAGSALIEMVLSYPGLGYLTLEAARKLDINIVMANLLIGSVMLLVANLVADLILTKVDPRISLQHIT